MTRIYLTTTIPYVNARPHLGFALEAVQADVLARFHRRRGAGVRLVTGTDDNSLKNVLAAEAAGKDVRDWVDRHADAIAALREPLNLSYDDFVRTSADPRHRPGVERLWRACLAAGDLYRGRYEGMYCVGCESYYTENELPDRRCPDQRGTAPTPSGGGCFATCRGWATWTSPSPGWSTAPMPTSPVGWATWSAAWSAWSTGTAPVARRSQCWPSRPAQRWPVHRRTLRSWSNPGWSASTCAAPASR